MAKFKGIGKAVKIVLLFCVITLAFQSIAFGEAQWTHERFAKFLVKQVKAERLLPVAAVNQDYFDLLRRLGVEPPAGWEQGKVLTEADLKAMLGLAPDAKYTFEELIKMVEDMVREILIAVPADQPISPILPKDPTAPPITPIVRPLTSSLVK